MPVIYPWWQTISFNLGMCHPLAFACSSERKPNGIRQLSDLEQADLKIGTTDPAMSTLGALSHAMFEDLGIASSLRKQQSIIVTTPTAHELILQMKGMTNWTSPWFATRPTASIWEITWKSFRLTIL